MSCVLFSEEPLEQEKEFVVLPSGDQDMEQDGEEEKVERKRKAPSEQDSDTNTVFKKKRLEQNTS